MIGMDPVRRMKAAGRLRDTPFSKLDNVSLSREQTEDAECLWCLHPDAPDEQIIQSRIGHLAQCLKCPHEVAECIHGMHERMARAIGSGSWPPGNQCHPNLYPHTNYHATRVYVEHENFLKNDSLNREVTDEEWKTVVVDAKVWPSLESPVQSIAEAKRIFSYDSQNPLVRMFDRPQWRERADRKASQPYTVFDMSTWLAFESCRRGGLYFIESFDAKATNIYELMKAIWGGTSGYAYFPDGRCDDHVTSNIDSTLTYSLGRITGLRTHEFGHNLQLQHEFGRPQTAHRSIMSYAGDNTPFQGYRLAGAPYNYVEDHSWPALEAKYGARGGDGAALPIEVVTTPPPPTDAPEIEGIFTARIDGDRIVVDGEPTIDYSLSDAKHTYIVEGLGNDRFRFRPKPRG